MSKVSIIVPIYNVAPYLRQCLDSVASQTYKDLEVLLVDDCGTDDSMAIAKDFIANYSGPIVFKTLHHDHNRGLSAARNTGINASSGSYLFFLDSDDWISNNCIQLLFDAIKRHNNVQLAIGGVDVIDTEREWNLLQMHSGIYESELFFYYVHNKYYIPVWNKLISKQFVIENKLFFEEGLIHEDYLWSFEVACHLKKMAIVEDKTYHYLRREGSLDKIDNKWIHNEHYSRACALQASYSMKYPKIRLKKSVFIYIERERVNLFVEAMEAGRQDICKKHYSLIRNTPYWGPLFLIIRHCSKASILRSIHKYMPKSIGYKYYMHIMNKYKAI